MARVSTMRRFSIALLVVTLVALMLLRRPPPPNSPAKTAPDPQVSKTPAPEPAQSMVFSNEGLAGNILRSAESVAGTGNAKVAVLLEGDARKVCILVAGMERNYSLDEGIEPEQLPFIAAKNFTVPNPHVLQTMSIFRSLAKKEMKFAPERGDRMIVLACPKEAWATLDLRWPERIARSASNPQENAK